MREQHQSWRCILEPEIQSSHVSNKPLGQSLGSKVKKKFKTGAEIQHNATSNTY